MKTFTLEIEACQTIEEAAQSMFAHAHLGVAEEIVAEFNGITLRARRSTPHYEIVQSYYTQRRDRARAEAAERVQQELRASVFPDLLEAVKSLYGDHGMVNHKIEALLKRCENLEAKNDEAAHDKF